MGNGPCTKPQVCEDCGDPKEAELTPTNDASDSTSGSGMKAVSVEGVGQKKELYLGLDLTFFSVLQ